MKLKRITALLLAVVLLLGVLPGVALAADTEEEALGEVHIFNGGQALSCLAVNGAVQTFNYVYYRYPSAMGYTREVPAYCINPAADGVAQKVPVGQSIEYIADQRATDPKVMGIVANGYPTKTLDSLGLESAVEGYYATKIALWCHLISGWDINSVTVNPSLSGAALTQAQRVLAAAKKTYFAGTLWTKVPTAGLTVLPDQEYAYPVTIDGVRYKQQVFTVTSETWVGYMSVNVAFSDPGAVPAGTRIVDMNNQDITAVTTTTVSEANYSGQFKVLYPYDAVAGRTGSVQFDLDAIVYRYGVYYATCAQTDIYGNVQSYMCDTDPAKNTAVSGISRYTDDGSGDPDTPETPETPPPDTGLRIRKLETGTELPLSGALFEVIDPDGATVGTFTTNQAGRIELELTVTGNYTVIERQSAPWHLLGGSTTQNVTLRDDEVAEVTFYNDPYGSLRIEKRSNTGDLLPGAVIQIKHIESGQTYTAESDFAGCVYFEQLLPGAYEIVEKSAPEGWLLDASVHNVTVMSGETAEHTLVNEELPGLRIVKYDRKNMVLMLYRGEAQPK